VLVLQWLHKSVVFNTPPLIAIFSKEIKQYEHVNIVYTVPGKNDTGNNGTGNNDTNGKVSNKLHIINK